MGDDPRGIAQSDETMLDRLAVEAGRPKIGRQGEIVDEDRLALQAVGLHAADVDGPRGLGAPGKRRIDPGLFVRFPDDGGGDRLTCRNAAADEVVEHAGVDCFGWAPPREPHPDLTASHDAVDVRSIGMNTEITGGCALEQEPRRRAKSGRDGVTLVAPRAEGALGGQNASDPVERNRSRGNVRELRHQRDFVVADVENVGESTKARHAAVVQPADGSTFDPQRVQPRARCRQRGGEAPANRRYNSGIDHSPL